MTKQLEDTVHVIPKGFYRQCEIIYTHNCHVYIYHNYYTK